LQNHSKSLEKAIDFPGSFARTSIDSE